MKELLVRLSHLDRRWVFLMVFILTAVPFFLPMKLPIKSTRYTQMVFQEIEAMKPVTDPGFKPLLLSMDFDPGTLAELGPMAKAMLRHVFTKKSGVVVLTFVPMGSALAQEILLSVAGDFKGQGIEEGVHFAFLGYTSPPDAVIQSIGRNIRDNYPKDFRGRPLEEIPLLAPVTNYRDFHIVVDLAGSSMPGAWMANAVERFSARFAMGVTNVMAADYTPFIPEQSRGMIAGLRGAAEYERMLNDHYGIDLGDGARGMDSQSVTHLFVLLLIVVGNIGYFLTARKKGATR
jgi:hypothetical protein